MLSLIKAATRVDKPVNKTKQKTIESVGALIGEDKAKTLFEDFSIGADDYNTWLDVIVGYATEEGININTKNNFMDVAYSVLENDPMMLDPNVQDIIVQKLWIDYKAKKQQQKVDRASRVAQEEEQLSYAINKMSKRGCNKSEENEEEWSDYDEDIDEYNDKSIDWSGDEFDDTLDDSSLSGCEIDDTEDDLDWEEEELSQFKKGQPVIWKQDNNQYKVEIPNGPGDLIGIVVNGRIKLVPSNSIKCVNQSEENQEFKMGKGSPKISTLHDVLTGEKTKEHLNRLQKQVETEGANAWTSHHAKSPKNPHPKGSIAHKSWQKGFDSAAKEIWAPKKVEIDSKTKPKRKK